MMHFIDFRIINIEQNFPDALGNIATKIKIMP